MSTKLEKSKLAHKRRKMRVRKRVNGSTERPRLVVNRSLKYMSVSVVDDEKGVTILGATTRKADFSKYDAPESVDEEGTSKLLLTHKVAEAYQLGQAIAEKAKEKGIKAVVFDRNGLRYHGRVRAVAEGARKGGLEL